MINRDDWLAAITEARTAPLPDSDAATCPELAELWGIDRSTALRRANLLVANGKAQRTTKLKRRCDGAVVSVPAYRLLNKKPEGDMREADTLDGADVIDTTPEPDDEDTFHARPHPRVRRRRLPEVPRRQRGKKSDRVAGGR